MYIDGKAVATSEIQSRVRRAQRRLDPFVIIGADKETRYEHVGQSNGRSPGRRRLTSRPSCLRGSRAIESRWRNGQVSNMYIYDESEQALEPLFLLSILLHILLFILYPYLSWTYPLVTHRWSREGW